MRATNCLISRSVFAAFVGFGVAIIVAQPARAQTTCTTGKTPVTIVGGADEVDFPDDVPNGSYAFGAANVWQDLLSDALTLTGSSPACWVQGIIDGPMGPLEDADTYYECSSTHGYDGGPCLAYHTTAGIAPASSGGNVIEQARIKNYGDGISIDDDAGTWVRVRASWFDYVHDDAIEDDWKEHSVEATDNLFERVTMAFAFRARSSAADRTQPSGREWVMRNNIVRIYRFTHAYKEKPGHGGVFKDDDEDNPILRFTGNIVLLGPVAGSGQTQFPLSNRTVECSGNVYLWDGTHADYLDMLATGDGADQPSNGARLAALNAAFPGCITVVERLSTETSAQFLARPLSQLGNKSYNVRVASWKSSHFPPPSCGIGQPGRGASSHWLVVLLALFGALLKRRA